MSIKTWINEFYPKPADETTKEDALEHSFRKWMGLLPYNLKRHKVVVEDGHVHSRSDSTLRVMSSSLWIGGDTCALCHHFYSDLVGSNCKKCPIFKLSKKTCGGFGNEDSAWSIWKRTGNVEPMVSLLYRALLLQKKKAVRK